MLLRGSSATKVTSREKEVKTAKDNKKEPKLEEFLKSLDFTGASVLLNFQRNSKDAHPLTLPWLGYSYFHAGEYEKAYNVYCELTGKGDKEVYHLYAACCLFYMGRHKEAEEEALKGPQTRLQNRILLHTVRTVVLPQPSTIEAGCCVFYQSLKSGDENRLVKYHQKITDSVEVGILGRPPPPSLR